jgi:hypothetical protein
MSLGRMFSLAMAIVAVLAVFVEIPVISDFAFWVLVVAHLSWHGFHRHNTRVRFRYWVMLDIVLFMAAIVAVFTYIPIVSDYAFWVLLIAYLINVGSTGFSW